MTTSGTKRPGCEADGCQKSADAILRDYEDGWEIAVCDACLDMLCVADYCNDAGCGCVALPSQMRGHTCDH
jgi:hypothetical protein